MGLKEALLGTPGEKQPAPEKYLRNTQLYKKAYMIEFYGTDKETPDDVFTFSLPPESEELGYTQRKTETKTFGGLHVDEYGMDAVKITLSGSTVNQTLKMVYRGGSCSPWLSGEEEIYYLRDLIKKYRSPDNLQKDAKGKIIIFDLSKLLGANNAGNQIKNYWQAFPGDFKIRRSNDRPFTYKYSFEFTGVSLENGEINGHGRPPELDKGKLGQIQKMMNDLAALVNRFDRWVNNVLDKINQVSALIDLLGAVLTCVPDMLASVADIAVKGVSSILSLPRAIQLKVLNIGLKLQSSMNGLVKSMADLVTNCRDVLTNEEYWDAQEVLDQYAMNRDEFKDSIAIMLDQAENAANELAAAAKSSDIPDVAAGNPDPITGALRIVLSYGFTAVTLKSTDSLESLAAEYMGDPDKAIDIATFNGVASLSDLKPGSIIRIPITRRTKKSANNRVFARREDRDNYGRDIMLGDDGYIAASNSGDYALASGARNLSQAVLLRLKESVKKRIRINAYGIRTSIGDPAAGRAYILSSIELTVSSDPRVSSVDRIRFKGEGDYMDVQVDYSDINNARGNAGGRV